MNWYIPIVTVVLGLFLGIAPYAQARHDSMLLTEGSEGYVQFGFGCQTYEAAKAVVDIYLKDGSEQATAAALVLSANGTCLSSSGEAIKNSVTKVEKISEKEGITVYIVEVALKELYSVGKVYLIVFENTH